MPVPGEEVAAGAVAGGAEAGPRRPPGWVLVAVTLALFAVWSNTFLAFEVLLAPGAGAAPLGWWDLVAVRFLPVAVLCGAWCLLVRRRESMAILRAHPGRLLLCALACVPGYNGFLYHGMQHHVAGPVASVLTSLTPLYLVALGALFLAEPLTARKLGGLVLGLGGVVLIATAREVPGESLGLRVAEVAVAPLCWSIHSALTRPVAREHSPVLWTFLVLVLGGLLVAAALPFTGLPAAGALDGREWGLVAFLVLPATIGGFAAWSWLLRHLPASTAGLTTFLNAPMTLASKSVQTGAFAMHASEWLGGLLALSGVALAVLGRPRRTAPQAVEPRVQPE